MVKECIQLINTTRNPNQNKGLPLAFGAQLDGFFSNRQSFFSFHVASPDRGGGPEAPSWRSITQRASQWH
jgi:hypothetical protein